MRLESLGDANVQVAPHEPQSLHSPCPAANIAAPTLSSHIITAQTGIWLLLVILVPLLVNLWGQQPFELPKVMFMRTLVWLLAAALLASSLLAHTSQRPSIQHTRANPLVGPLLLLTLVIVATTFTAANGYLSLWGSYTRSQGAITLLTYLLLCGLAATYLYPIGRVKLILMAMVTAGMLVAGLSLIQSLGWNPFGLLTTARSTAYGTLGRANFVGAYLAMLTPLALALCLTSGTGKERVAWSIALGVGVVTVALTLTRSAWLATLVANTLFSLLWWSHHLARRWRMAAWGTLGLMALSGPISVIWLGPGRADSLAARWHIWQGAWTLILQRPLLGYGADALGPIFWRVYSPQLVYTQGRNIVVDRAHNLLLDWLVIAGVPGLLAYLLIVTTFVFVVWRALRRPASPTQRALLIGILAAIAANIVNNLTSFDVTPTAMATWLLMGMGVALATPRMRHTDAPFFPPPTSPHNEQTRSWQWLLMAMIFLSIGAAIWQINVRPLAADIAARFAQRAVQAEDWPRANLAATQAVAQWPLEPAHYVLVSQSAWRLALTQQDPSRWLAASEAALLEARRLRPDDPLVWQQLAHFYTATAHQFGHDTEALAATAFQQAVTLAPTHATLYVAWGKTAFAQGNVSQAATLLRQAVALDATHGEAYLTLGAAEATLGRGEIALADYREAVRLMPTSAAAYTALARGYWQLARPQAALRALEQALYLSPHHAPALALSQEIHAAWEE